MLDGRIGYGHVPVCTVFYCTGCIRCDNSDVVIVYRLGGGQRNICCDIYFIYYMYLRPYLSETRGQLVLVLSFDGCSMARRDVLLHVLPVTAFLMSRFAPIR